MGEDGEETTHLKEQKGGTGSLFVQWVKNLLYKREDLS